MLRLAPFLAIAIALTITTPARADITGDPDLVQMATEMRVPTPKLAVLHHEACPDDRLIQGDCAYEDGHVYIRPVDPRLASALADRMILFHELGHRYTQERPWVLRAFNRIMHGWGGDERFGAAYDNCARDQESPGPADARYVEAWNENDGYHPYRATHDRVCRLIRRAF